MNPCSPLADVVAALDRLSIDMTERDIVQAGVDIAQAATASGIAYLHFLNEDQNTIELGVWSHDTLLLCNAVYARHYPIDAAGIWADSARNRQPCVHNDYAGETCKRGLPEGHAPLIRHLGLPVVEDDGVRMLVGVGNKKEDYGNQDIDMLGMVARRIWSLIRQRRLLEGYIDIGKRYRYMQEIAAVCGLAYDVDEDRLELDAIFGAMFHTRHATETPSSLHGLLAFVAAADRERVRAAFAGGNGERRALRIGCRRVSGERFPAELKLEFRPREVGKGDICVGILQDISEQLVVEDLRRRADVDPLTGLPNRNRLESFFREGFGRRGVADHCAFHYIDLDAFKPVNDSFGHPVGDEVLRIVAQRLLQALRRNDVAVRMGGDEFAVVQTGLEDPAAARVLADKIIAAIGEPIAVRGHRIEIGASIGIAISGGPAATLGELSARADRALYQAKSAGGKRCVIADGD